MPRPSNFITAPVVAPPLPKLAYNMREAAQALGIGKTTLYKLRATGALPTVEVAGVTLVRAETLAAVLDSAPVKGGSGPVPARLTRAQAASSNSEPSGRRPSR